MASNVDDETDDYMSDGLLEKCGDCRPGIVSKSLAKRYKIENEQRENSFKQKRQKLHVVEREKREEALAKPISSENKGFAMMSRMGYKPGMTLGKPIAKNNVDCEIIDLDQPSCSKLSDGRLKEPIGLDLKFDRKGLGHKIIDKEKMAAIEGLRKALQINRKLLEKDYDTKRRDAIYNKVVKKNLIDSQKACFELDSRSTITEPIMDWYWPERALRVEEEEIDDEDSGFDVEQDLLNDSEKLLVLTRYLRKTYFYCVWCGATFENHDDLSNNCPGDTKEAHDNDDDLAES